MSDKENENESSKVQCTDIIRKIRPVLYKITFQVVVLVVVIFAYKEYKQSNDDYKDFIKELDKPLITDIELVNFNESCPSGYEEIQGTTFPKVKKGCSCDGLILEEKDCEYFKENFLYKGLSSADISSLQNTWSRTCSSTINNSNDPSTICNTSNLRTSVYCDEENPCLTSSRFYDEKRCAGEICNSLSPNYINDSSCNTNACDRNSGSYDPEYCKNTFQCDPRKEFFCSSDRCDPSSKVYNPNDSSCLTNPCITSTISSFSTTTDSSCEESSNDTCNPKSSSFDITSASCPKTKQTLENLPSDLAFNPLSDATPQDHPDLPKEIYKSYVNPYNEFYYNPKLTKQSNINYKVYDGNVIAANENNIPLDLVAGPKYPKKCNCYREILEREESPINNWVGGKKICVLKEEFSMKEYLDSAVDFRWCPHEDKCQKYFCKTNKKACPIIDFDFSYDANGNLEVRKSAHLLKNHSYGAKFLNEISMPFTDLKIGLSATCADNEKVSTGINHPLLEKPYCPKNQIYSMLAETTAQNLLNANGNIYSNLEATIPDFENYSNKEAKYYIEGVHPFNRNTFTCFMNNEDLEQNVKDDPYKVFPDSDNINILKLIRSSYPFVTLNVHFDNQYNLQIAQIIITAAVVLFNCIIAVLILCKTFWEPDKIRLAKVAHKSKKAIEYFKEKNDEKGVKYYEEKLVKTEKEISESKQSATYRCFKTKKFLCYCLTIDFFIGYLSLANFIFDLLTGVFGGINYFNLKKIVDEVGYINGLGCIENTSASYYSAFGNALQGTYNLNFQVFLIIIIKIAYLVLSVLAFFIFTAHERINNKKCCSKAHCGNCCFDLFVIFFESITEEDYPEYSEEMHNQKVKQEERKERRSTELNDKGENKDGNMKGKGIDTEKDIVPNYDSNKKPINSGRSEQLNLQVNEIV